MCINHLLMHNHFSDLPQQFIISHISVGWLGSFSTYLTWTHSCSFIQLAVWLNRQIQNGLNQRSGNLDWIIPSMQMCILHTSFLPWQTQGGIPRGKSGNCNVSKSKDTVPPAMSHLPLFTGLSKSQSQERLQGVMDKEHYTAKFHQRDRERHDLLGALL